LGGEGEAEGERARRRRRCARGQGRRGAERVRGGRQCARQARECCSCPEGIGMLRDLRLQPLAGRRVGSDIDEGC
jgi:hypothetical protein